jgi:predicted permease
MVWLKQTSFAANQGARASHGNPRLNQLILTQVFTLFLLMGAGVAARRTGCFTDAVTHGLSDLLMNFCLPMLVLASFLRPFDPGMLANAGRMLLYSLLVNLLLVLTGFLLFMKAPAGKRPVLRFITAFSNSGFMGLALLAAVFPDVGVFYGAVFGMGFNLCAFTFGILFFHAGGRRPDLRGLFLNPVILSTLAGLACFLGSVRVPLAVVGGLGLMGGMTMPVSMLIIGAMLAEARPMDILGGPAEYAVSAARLLLAPLLTLALCLLLRVDPTIAKVLVLLEALPAATIVAIFGERYGGDRAFISRCTFLTTALSLLTLPVIVKLMGRFL